MKTIVFAEHLTFPESVHDLESFRHWVTSDDFPEKARVFGREFKLSRETTKHGVSKFTLEMR